MTGPDASSLLLTPGELASLLRVSRKAIYAMHSRGELSGVAVKIGRRLRFRREEVLEWLGRAPSSPGARR